MQGQFSRTLQYLYFLRFSLLLWVFPFIFWLLDSGLLLFNTNTLTRGIFVPEYLTGYLCAAFFVTATGCVALITARTVVINGVERFTAKCPACVDDILDQHDPECSAANKEINLPPEWLLRLLVGSGLRQELQAFVVALIPALSTFFYLVFDSYFESVPLHRILIGTVSGTLVGGLFWYGVNAFYYLAYERPYPFNPMEPLSLGRNAARTILLPRRCFGLVDPGPGVNAAGVGLTLEDITTSLRTGRTAAFVRKFGFWFNQRLGLYGYVYDTGDIFEAQLFSIIAAFGFIALFLVMYPLTAPRFNRWAPVALLGLFAVLGWVLKVIWSGQCRDRNMLIRWKLRLGVVGALFGFAVLVLWLLTSPDRFPTIASILLMVIVLGWIFGGLAFFLDRYRVPVLTFVLVAAVLPRIFHVYDWHNGFEERYVSTIPHAPSLASLPTPAQILNNRLSVPGAANDHYPLIVVTSTGGGLHASAWTARVLRQLYLGLSPAERPTFTGHLLLFSTVSGGSVGLSYYLQAIHNNSRNPDLDRMVVAAQCSSLEAVGWGLVYNDFMHAIIPGLPLIFPPSSGNEDLDQSPLLKDRTWALRKAFERNSYDDYCYESAKLDDPDKVDPHPLQLDHSPGTISWNDRIFPSALSRTERLTIEQLTVGQNFPAFTMNTTTVEGGDRFLLANYRLPGYILGHVEGAPAESFLSLFGNAQHPDLPLASASQLSATFPYVSSAVRIPHPYTTDSVHFVDGGYYDDDGTSSAMEFLRYAIDLPDRSSPGSSNPQDLDSPRSVGQKLQQSPLRILYIEIRNSADTDAPGHALTPKALHPTQQPDPKGKPKNAGLLEQLGFPLEGFWNAGHGSVTGRDRNGLDLLLQGHENVLELHQIIFDDKTVPEEHHPQDPLSWSLTPRERAEVARSSDPDAPDHRLKPCYEAAVRWFDDFSRQWKATGADPTRCYTPPK